MTKINIQTYGCSSNFSDSEVMYGLLRKAGFQISDIGDAYIVIINACTVKGNSNVLRNLKKIASEYPYKKIILAGCVTPDLMNEAGEIAEFSVITTHNIRDIVSVVEETLNDNYVEEAEKNEYEKINLPRIRKNPIVSIIPISSGCVSKCSYCSVRLIKGELFSYPSESIIAEAKKSIEDGCRELWITSQDTPAYGMDWDGKSHLPELLKKLTELEGNFLIRLGMGNPHNFIPIADELIEIFRNRKMFRFLHVPLQSGSDEILAMMNRKYSAGQFMKLIEKFRKGIPKLTLSTDIICGFPGETEEQFQESLDLINNLRPDVLNISRFQARPGTAAAGMDSQIEGRIIKERSRKVTSAFDWIAFDTNRNWKKWKGTVIIDEQGKNGTWIARNIYYKPVIVRGDYKLGDVVNVEIKDITKYDLRA